MVIWDEILFCFIYESYRRDGKVRIKDKKLLHTFIEKYIQNTEHNSRTLAKVAPLVAWKASEKY